MARSLTVGCVLALVLAGCAVGPYQGLPIAATGPVAAQARASKELKVTTENFAKVNAGLYRGGMLTDADWAVAAKFGIKTDIIFLDPKGEKDLVDHEKAVTEKLGITCVNMALPWGVKPPKAMVDKFLAILNDPKSQPVYVHCKHGRDRTGEMVAAYRMTHDGLSPKQALEEMTTFGFEPKTYPWMTAFVLEFKTPAAGK